MLDPKDFSTAESLRESLNDSISRLLLADDISVVQDISTHCISLLYQICEIVFTKRK